MKKIKVFSIAVIMLATLSVAVVPMSGKVFASAESVKENILNKAYATQLYYCYTDDKVFNPDVDIRNNAGSKEMLRLLLNQKNKSSKEVVAVSDETARTLGATRYLPTAMTANSRTSCRTLIESSLSQMGKTIPAANASLAEKKAFMEMFGYSCPGVDSADTSGTITCRLLGSNDGNNEENALKGVQGIFGYSPKSAMQFSDSQKLLMYQTYLQGVYKAEIACGSSGVNELKEKAESNSTYSGQYEVYEGLHLIKGDGKVGKNCAALVRKDKTNETVNGTQYNGSGNYFMKSGATNFGGTLDVLKKTTVSQVSDDYVAALEAMVGSAAGYDSSTGLNTNEGAYDGSGTIDPSKVASTDDEGTFEGSEDDPCFDQSGALGWFICPVLKGASEVLETAYDSWIEPLLQVNGGILSALNVDDDSHGIYQAWGVFRDFANIVFVIMLLFVIFSQLTGYGIDNYGIKRLLPRLIVTAILVNFSFLICQLVVDISDIVGAALQDLLITIADDNISLSLGTAGEAKGIASLTAAIVQAAITLGAAIGIAWAVSGFAFILPVFTGIISAVIGIFFGFVLLGARQAVIVILVVTSPLAFILNMLPNTNQLFTRWRKIFVNLLLVYPAAGLLIGGGYLAARVILSVDGESFFLQMVGLLLMVIPYFFIIPLVRGSMSAIGNIGGMISNFGRNMQRGATGLAQNSDWYKDRQAQFAAAGSKGLGKPGSRLNKLTRRRSTSAARQMQAWEKRQAENRAAEVYQENLSEGWQPSAVLQGNIEEALGKDLSKSGNRSDALRAIQRFSGSDLKGSANLISRYLSSDDFSEKIRSGDENAVRTVSVLQEAFNNDDRLKSEVKARDKSAFDMVNMGAAEFNADGSVKARHDIHWSGFGSDQDMSDRANQSEAVWRRDFADGKMSQQMALDLRSENAPSNVRSKISEDKSAFLETIGNADSKVAGDIMRSYAAGAASPQIDDNGKQRNVEALKLAGGLNVMGATGAISGYMPQSGDMDGTFNANSAYRTKDGRTILEDTATGRVWDATNAREATNEAATLRGNIATSYNSPSGSNAGGAKYDGNGRRVTDSGIVISGHAM